MITLLNFYKFLFLVEFDRLADILLTIVTMQQRLSFKICVNLSNL